MPKNKLSQSELKLFGNKKWEFGYERRMTYFRIRGFNYAHHFHFPKVFGVDLKYEIFRVKEGNVSLYREREENSKALKVIENKILNPRSTNFIDKLSKIIEVYFKEFQVMIKKLPTDYKSYSNNQILKIYKEIYKVDNKIALPNRLTFTQFEEVLTGVIKKSSPTQSENTEELLQMFSMPRVPTPLEIYNTNLYKILSSHPQKRKKLLSLMHKKYIHWGMFDWNYEVLEEDYHGGKLREIDLKDAKSLDNKYKNQNKKIKDILKKYHKNSHFCALLILYNTIASLKEWKNYYREQSSYKLKFLMEEISRRFKISNSILAFMNFDEICLLLKNKLKINCDELGTRIKNSAYVFMGDSLKIITDIGALKSLDEQLNSFSEEIKGMIVFKGTVKSFVKVVVSDKDFYKINAGDILVTSTTRPSFIPVMEKAGAFVTNEGGLLSHAAIIAREMKKPCIVGTKVATKVLKDGDLVEVDANTGVVKILKRA